MRIIKKEPRRKGIKGGTKFKRRTRNIVRCPQCHFIILKKYKHLCRTNDSGDRFVTSGGPGIEYTVKMHQREIKIGEWPHTPLERIRQVILRGGGDPGPLETGILANIIKQGGDNE
jgi:hypothetical protein